jgi:hypothetical protein
MNDNVSIYVQQICIPVRQSVIIVNEVAVVHCCSVALFFDADRQVEFDVPHERHPVRWPFLITPFLGNSCISDDALVIEPGIVVEGNVVIVNKSVDKFADYKVDSKSAASPCRLGLDRDLCPHL